MGQVVRKVHCTEHEDRTPSCAVYEDGSMYCFSCTKYFKGTGEVVATPVAKEQENLRDKFIYIDSLPRMVHRELNVPYDSRGYYVVWPASDYYKLRLWAPRAGEPKYIGAKGHKKPWFCLRAYKKVNACIIVEGELNALSIAATNIRSEYDILSPGGASNFHDSEMKERVPVFANYGRVLVLVDNDKAGVEAAIKVHGLIKPHCSHIKIALLQKGSDCNEILVRDGKEALEQLILGM